MQEKRVADEEEALVILKRQADSKQGKNTANMGSISHSQQALSVQKKAYLSKNTSIKSGSMNLSGNRRPPSASHTVLAQRVL